MAREPLRIEPRFSEAINGASVGNCYIESGFSGKGQSRLRGRSSMAAASGLELPEGFGGWDAAIAAHQSSKTKNVYILSDRNYRVQLWVLIGNALHEIKDFGADYAMKTKCSFAEMRFLQNSYVDGSRKTDEGEQIPAFSAGNYAILLATKNKLWVLDDLDPLGKSKLQDIPVPPVANTGRENMEVGSVCVVANRIIVSEAGTANWRYSSVGGLEQEKIPMFGGLDYYEAEYSGDNIERVEKAGGIRLAIFSERTLEIWDITGNADDPFTTSYAGQVYKIGCLPQSVQEIGDTLYFCGIEDLSMRYGVYSISREGLKKLSENPLDAELTLKIKGMKKPVSGGKYAENAASFYLLHLEDEFSGSFSLAYNIPESAFSKFYTKTDSPFNATFNCILSTENYAIGLRGGIFSAIADGVPEYSGYYTEKALAMPVYDAGGIGHFLLRKITIDAQTIDAPRRLPENPPARNAITIDYSTDGTDTFIGKRAMPLPERGNGKLYPLRIFGLGRCNNLKLRLIATAGNFIINAITIETEDCL